VLAFTATIILVVAMTAGQVILDAIGIHMHSLKVARRHHSVLVRCAMLFGKWTRNRKIARGRTRSGGVSLAVPSIAGGGAMMAVIVLTDNDVYTVPERIGNRCCPFGSAFS